MRWLHFLIALGIFTLDQLTKALVEARIPLHDDRAIVPGFFRLTHVKNRGAAFGIFAESPWPKIWLLILLSAIALGVVLTLLWRHQATARRTGVGLALILGGAIGNVIDRLLYGHVVDFLDFHLKAFGHFPAFNVADSAICIGAGLFILDELRRVNR